MFQWPSLQISWTLLQNSCGARPDSQPLSICTYGDFADVRMTSFLPRLPLKLLYTSPIVHTTTRYPDSETTSNSVAKNPTELALFSTPVYMHLVSAISEWQLCRYSNDLFAAQIVPQALVHFRNRHIVHTTSIQTPLLCPDTIIKCYEKTIGNTSADDCSSEIPRRKEYQNNLILTSVWEEEPISDFTTPSWPALASTRDQGYRVRQHEQGPCYKSLQRSAKALEVKQFPKSRSVWYLLMIYLRRNKSPHHMRRIWWPDSLLCSNASRNLQLPDSSSNVSGEYRRDSLFSFVSYSLVDWAQSTPTSAARSLLLVDCEKGLTKAPMHIEIILHCMNCFTTTVL